MNRYILDTNHAGSLLRDNRTLWERIDGTDDAVVHLCAPSLCELWFMMLNSDRRDENVARLEQFLVKLPVLPLDERAVREYGMIRVELKRAGRPIPRIDLQIAAITRSGGFTLPTADRHFDHVGNLTVENWLQ